MKTIAPLFLIPLLALVLAAESCSSPVPAENNSTMPPTIPVTIATAAGSTTEGISAAGRVEALRSAAIATRVMGAITRVYVQVGDKVKQGQLLVAISGQDLDAKKAQADAQIGAATAAADNARKDLDRYTNLYARQSATPSELDNATLRYKAAAANLTAANQLRKEVDASIAYTRLTAPFDGVVTTRTADEGSLANPGMSLLTVEQSGALRVTATVAENDVARIRTGSKVRLSIRAAGLETEGVVTEVGASSVASGGQYPVKISLPATAQKQLYAGMYVNVNFQLTPETATVGATPANKPPNQEAAVLVPASALVHNDQLTGIYTISNTGTALLRWVRTGKTLGNHVEILSGLAPGEPFILQAEGKLYNGAPVSKK